MAQEKIFKFNLINNVLTNFASKYQLYPFMADNEYKFISKEEVQERTNLNDLILDMKKEYGDFWHVNEKDIPYIIEGMPVFELVNDITKLASFGYRLNEMFKEESEKLHVGEKAQYKEFFNLQEHSKKIINGNYDNSSFLLGEEANLGFEYDFRAKDLSEFRREIHKNIKTIEDMGKYTKPTHKDILKGAFTSIAYGVYLNENKEEIIRDGFANPNNLPSDLMKISFNPINITDTIRDFYKKDVKEINLPRNGGGDLDLN